MTASASPPLAKLTCGKYDDTVHDETDAVEHCGERQDLNGHRPILRTHKLRKQCKDEQRHLRIKQIGKQPLPENLSNRKMSFASCWCSWDRRRAKGLPCKIE